ncbi:hypothetical protein KQI61_04300 [Anaerocolumna aminovalerica]|uniref:hypothetical protein n=1 Tax=Anaerocolumna aminovalerica TaxID=1527 RepID=UPI001C0EB5E9|nr:hypothetical protein [Anaerocolumna aminovalerica]MBU5331409.1 hypothetical protein [Anaerocolumna aminovalerica]
MSDKGCEKLIKQLKRLNPNNKIIYLATMKTDYSVSLGELVLEREDLMIGTNITNLKQGDVVLIIKINEEKYAIIERVRDL